MKAWTCSDRGPHREINEDTCFAFADESKQFALCTVCDGMGGAKAGNVASGIAVQVFTQIILDGIESASDFRQIRQLLEVAAESANDAVFELSKSSEQYEGMGTTLVGVVVKNDNCAVINIGDSRAYHISDSGIRQITTDHSLVQELLDRGEISRNEADTYPGKHLITRAIGTEERVRCDIFSESLAEGEAVLLCSDGLLQKVGEQEILFEILHGGEASNCCERLINISLLREVTDNVSAVLLTR